jgi:class 3 adenylate cyclase/tetratricopeptide (TPR) repeat protein
VICSSCGSANEAGRKFCGECGTRLVPGCPSCGAQNAPGTKFCGECGTPLAGAAAAATLLRAGEPLPAAVPPPASGEAALAPEAGVATERRLVSVLFADLVGFTALAASRDAEAVRELLTRYFETSRQTIERYGGTVEKFIGDAVMAVWGAPVAQEDDAERAVRAGMELVVAVRDIGREADLELNLRAGILTGEAAVTIGATNQGMVAGDLVNTASRLQSVAPAGAVLVGEATRRAASAAILFEEAGPQVLKGKEAPVAAWRAVRVVAERGGANRAAGLEAPFVGRETELRLLKDRFHATSRDGRARLVSITGQAGIGKSRLAREFSIYMDGLVETVYWHDGRSPAYGEGVTFWALGEMVRQRARLVESDDEATTRARIAATLAEYVPDEAERRWIEPALLALLGAGESPAGGRDALFTAWRTFFERIAAAAPTVLVFEDLQWADAGVIDFVEHLLEWSAGYPLYLVTLARPELLERRPDWGAGRRDFLALSLDPLPDEAMHELLTGLVPGIPEAAANAVVARADGIPLYAVETVRMLIAEGRLEERDGIYVPTGPLDALAVPETLQALIAARLDALDPADRSLLQDAGVLGQSFSAAALAAVSGRDEAEVEARLRALARREVVTLVTDPRSPERGQWTFSQALIREVAYGSLGRRDRRARHLAAARYFEAIEGPEVAGALAYHYLDAYRAAPEGAEGEAVAGQARIALRAAAERAAALGSSEQALAYLESALEVTTDPSDEADLHQRAAEAADARADRARAGEHYRRAIQLWNQVGDRSAELRATVADARSLGNLYRLDDAVALLEPALEAFGDLGGTADGVALVGELARVEMLRERSTESTALADRALEDAEAMAVRPAIADLLITKGVNYSNVGRAIEGRALLEAGIRIADEDDLVLIGLRGRINLSGSPSIEPRNGLAVAREAMETARRIGNRRAEASILGNYAFAALGLGQWDELLAETRSAAAAVTASPVLQGNLLQVAAFRGDTTDLDALADQARDLDPTLAVLVLLDARANLGLVAGRFGDATLAATQLAEQSPPSAPAAFVVMAHAAAWSRDVTALRRATDGLEATHIRGFDLDASRVALRAAAAALDGRRPESIAGFLEAMSRLRGLGLRLSQMLVGIDVAATLGADEPDSAALVDEARSIMTELRARALLDRLDEALALRGPAAAARPAPRAGATSTSGVESDVAPA